MTYCNGNGCMLSQSCRRWTEGQRVIKNNSGDTDQHRFIDHCDVETRELYIGEII